MDDSQGNWWVWADASGICYILSMGLEGPGGCSCSGGGRSQTRCMDDRVPWCKPHKVCCTGYSSDRLVREKEEHRSPGEEWTRGRFLPV